MNKIYPLVLIASTMCFATRIGVLKGDAACNEEVSIRLDTEDSDPSTQLVSGSSYLPGVQIANDKSSIRFRYCVLNVDQNFSNAYRGPYDYAVLMLDNSCPQGTFKFKRFHDTEDNNNSNSSQGNIGPNVVNGNATLYYCLVPGNPQNYSRYYPLADEGYGVFANTNFKRDIEHKDHITKLRATNSEIYIDDEDSKNKNSWDYYGYTDVNRINKIMSGGKNTTIHVAYRTVEEVPLRLAKSATAEMGSASVDVGQMLAPKIKGLDRSIVSVDIRSAGDVKISIANVNGAVVASISEKNLQAGVHQIKWNSGIIPNGRYIVTVKQNGLVNAKNVILK